MPEYLAPGVYVEEVSFRSKSIEGVGTTTTGLVGPTRFGPTALVPNIVTSLGEFERVYGDRKQLVFGAVGTAPTHNFMWHAARAFFGEGGQLLYISRIFRPNSTTDSGRASSILPTTATVASANTITVKARFPGGAGNVVVRFTLNVGQSVLGKA